MKLFPHAAWPFENEEKGQNERQNGKHKVKRICDDCYHRYFSAQCPRCSRCATALPFHDPENENLIQKAFEKLMHGKTVIIIAHRLSTVRNADHIIVMDNGRVAEEGSHDALLQKGGRYASMWKTYNETASWTMEKEVPVNG